MTLTEPLTIERAETRRGNTQPAVPKKQAGRLPFLDWTRGLAAMIMLQGHVFHSFARTDLQNSGPWVISQFIGGMTPAIFLFLMGVTLAFGMDGRSRKGAEPVTRWRTALNRAGYFFLIAFAFRIQLWLFSWPQSAVTDILKVDILNCMGAAVLAMSAFAMLSTAQRIHAGFLAGAGIAVAAPLVSLIGPSLPSALQLYLVPDGRYFSFFPWAAFVAFGLGCGSVLRLVTQDQMHRVMQWSAIVGFGLIISAQYFSNLPYSLYPSVDFWLNSPGLIFIKFGVILVILALAFLWTHHGAGEGWSPLRQLGTTSLLVYWVHIELVYGRWFGSWKEALTISQCVAVSVGLMLLMLGLSWLRHNWNLPELRLGSIWPSTPEPRRASGD